MTAPPPTGTFAWQLWKATGAFIHNYAKWDWYVTLTFRFAVTQPRAIELLCRWLESLAAEARSHVLGGCALENHGSGLIHIHTLVCFEDACPVTTDRGDDLWTFGLSHVRVFNPSRGGAWYIAKETIKARERWGQKLGCPRTHRCRRKGGCARAKAHNLDP
jgi:hypothetical protein